MKTNFNFVDFVSLTRALSVAQAAPLIEPSPAPGLASPAGSVLELQSMPLSEVEPGDSATITNVDRSGPQGRRLGDLGLLPRTLIKVVRRAPLGDPTEFELRGYRLCLRRQEAARVRVRLNGRGGRARSPARDSE